MTVFFTSDTHLGHKNIIPLANRPFSSVEEMNETIISRWNYMVRPTDTVYHLGDVALGTIAESLPLVKRLNGRKMLIIGNHDRIFAANKVRHIDRFMPIYGDLFDGAIRASDSLILNGRKVNLSHFPYDGDSHEDERYREYRLQDTGDWLIHGHTHSDDSISRSKRGSLQIHVGVDAWDFYPVHEDIVSDILLDHS